jgi:ATP synthase protein I
MAEPVKSPSDRMIGKVHSSQQRIARARKQKETAWESIAILGVVGWSVALPTLTGIAAGLWIDGRWPSRFSWTLMLLIGGLIVGCVNAWMHVKGDTK